MINIVTALACEASPIIQRYKLKKSQVLAVFPVYENDSMTLIISGVGKFASACAVGFLQSRLQSSMNSSVHASIPHIWLNVGIAGHATLDQGAALLAHKISDVAADCSYYPCITFDVPCITAEVITVDKAETHYPTQAVYDMEALGFCAAASRFSSFEQIHSLKIISDNESVSPARITKHLVEDLVANQLTVLSALLEAFAEIQAVTATMYTLPEDYPLLIEQHRFTVTQQNQLKRLLMRWRVLIGLPLNRELELNNFKNANQVLAAIEDRLQRIPFGC
jgi:adenosylhomocysteine nucleosidase